MHTSPSSLLFFVVFHTGAIQCYFSLPNCIDSIIYFVFAQFGMSITHCQKIELLQKWSTFDINIPSIILYNNSLKYHTLARTHTQNLHYSPFIFPVNSTIRFSSSRTRAASTPPMVPPHDFQALVHAQHRHPHVRTKPVLLSLESIEDLDDGVHVHSILRLAYVVVGCQPKGGTCVNGFGMGIQ